MRKVNCKHPKPFSRMAASSDGLALPVHDGAKGWLAQVGVKTAVFAGRAAKDEFALEYSL